MTLPVSLAFLLLSAVVPPVVPTPSACALRVEVVDPEGRPVAGARLGAASRTAPSVGSGEGDLVETDAQGRAELSLAPDLYRWAVASDRFPTTDERVVDLLASCAAGDLGRVRLAPGAALEGSVVDAVGDPVAGASVVVGWDPRTPSYLNRRDGPFVLPHRKVSTDGAGRFRLTGLAPDVEYQLGAEHDRHRFPAASAVAGGSPVRILGEPAAYLRVEVVDVEERPIEGAGVRVQALGDARAVGGLLFAPTSTDAAGAFEQASLAPGQVVVEVNAPGYEPARRILDLAPGEARRERFVVAPVPSAPVDVELVDPDGEPVPDVHANLTSLGQEGGHLYLPARSDARGRVSWPRIPLGHYRFAYQPPRGLVAERPEPTTIEVGEAGVRLRVVLHRPPGRAVEGRVVWTDGTGVAGAAVRVLASPSAAEAVTDAGGELRFRHLPFGVHRVSLEAPGVAGLPARQVTVGTEPEPWVLEVEPGVRVSGSLVLPAGFEPEGAWEVQGAREGAGADGWVDGELHYSFPPLAPGRWTLTARNGAAHASAQVELAPGDGPMIRDLHLEVPLGFPVTGVLLHRGAPLAGARVNLRPQDLFFPNLSATTDDGGRFELTDVPAGAHHFVVGWGGAPVLQRVVTVSGATDLSRELRFAWVRGRVEVEGVDPTTLLVRLHPLGPENGEVWVYSSHSYPEWATPLGDGSFEAGPLEEGRWRLQVAAPGHVEAKAEVTIAGADVLDLVLAPEPTQGLSFRLVTASGRLPDRVSATYRPDGGGDPVHSFFEPVEPVVHFADAPHGRGTLEIDAGYGKVGPVPVEVPGPVVEVELPPLGKLEAHVPLLAEAERERAVVTIRPIDGGGNAVRGAPLRSLGRAYAVLPPGTYEIRVDAPDGRSWSELVEIRDQETTKVELR